MTSCPLTRAFFFCVVTKLSVLTSSYLSKLATVVVFGALAGLVTPVLGVPALVTLSTVFVVSFVWGFFDQL